MVISSVCKRAVFVSRGSFLIAFALIAITVGAVSAAPNGDHANNAYQVKMKVTKDGKLVESPNLLLAIGKPARMWFTGKDGKNQGLRIQIVANPAPPTDSGQATVQVDMQVHESVDGAWVLLSEPSLRVADATPASMSVDTTFGKLQIDLTVTGTYSSKAVGFVPHACPDDPPAVASSNPQIASVNPQINCPHPPCCCRGTCSDGRHFVCCGGISCCDPVCGVCCSP